MLKKIKSILDPLLDLVYPNLCISCDEEDPVDNSCFCIDCMDELPFAHLHNQKDNIVEKFFWGRLIVEKGTALFYFHKGEMVQDMIHRLKYKNQAFIGNSLGIEFGNQLIRSQFLEDIDLIIPIPIHKSKKKTRHYNQSALIANSMSKISGVPWSDEIIVKIKKTTSQTDKTRDQRIENLKGSFKVIDHKSLNGKHVLIIDDILTTGATFETVGSIIAVQCAKISVAVIAVGKY